MPIQWKVRQILDKEMTNYRFWKESGLSRPVAYAIVNGEHESMDVRTIDKLVPYMRKYTGDKTLQIGDIVEYVIH